MDMEMYSFCTTQVMAELSFMLIMFDFHVFPLIISSNEVTKPAIYDKKEYSVSNCASVHL